ncbi:sensor histidine kinase [Novispirillum sp. DQ9]|uniref:sensor histidine kinase n=1 Tax=Novispirillum sp. DQ9 TaxID=3398612 RepID=UPI003C7A03DE
MTTDNRGAEREKAEGAVEEDRVKGGPFVRAVEATRMPMVVTDPTIRDNPIIFANQAFLDLSGYTLDEVLGSNYHFLSGSDTDPAVRDRVARAMSARHDVTEEVLLYTKGGRRIWVSLFVSTTVEGDRVTQHFASFLDISDRVRAERRVDELNATLEAQVELRTRRLEEANHRLREEIARRQRLEATLRDALQHGQELLAQKSILIKEIHHRTKNALSVAAALLQIQGAKSDNPETRQALWMATSRLTRISEVYALLGQDDAPDTIDAAIYIPQLSRHMVASHADPDRITLDTTIADVAFPPDVAVSLGLIITEAMTNAFKHAFLDTVKGSISITLHRAGDGLMHLRVSDDGAGLSGDRRPGAFGLDLIDLLARKLKGTARFDSGTGAGRGLTVSVAFPAPSMPA